jgi:hypothetical protein
MNPKIGGPYCQGAPPAIFHENLDPPPRENWSYSPPGVSTIVDIFFPNKIKRFANIYIIKLFFIDRQT